MRDLRNQYPFRGDEEIDLTEAMRLMDQHAGHGRARAPARAHAVRRRHRRHRRGEARASCSATRRRETLDQLKQFLEILEEAGYIRKQGQQLGADAARHAQDRPEGARRDLLAAQEATPSASTASATTAAAASAPTTPRPTSSATRSTSHLDKTIMNAHLPRGPARARASCTRTTSRSTARSTLTQTATVMMVDLSWSMALRGSFQAAKKVALALQQPDPHPVHARQPLHHRLLRLRPRAEGRAAAVRALGRVRARHEHAPRADDRAEAAREAQAPAPGRSS